MDSDDFDLNTNRRNSLAISALLNDKSIDPVASLSTNLLTPEEKRANRKSWHGFATEDVSKAKRKRISTQQCNRLKDIFQQTDTPSSEVREQLADELDMTKREVQVWFQNRRAKANRARAAAATLSISNHSDPVTSSTVSARYDPIIRSDHQHHSIASMMPRLALPPPTINHYYQPSSQPQPFIKYIPPPSRRSSDAFSDSSTPPTRSSSLQPIAPMPPSISVRSTSIVMPPPIASSYSTPLPHTPPPPIAPRNHSIHRQQGAMENGPIQSRNPASQPAKKRPKSVIGVLNTTP
ncbi:homeobox domain-domain-containing protein [Absidia repens]|uniref:Homeobox domain-domain-containing protein n=1 Tax=Absidia repens TaxID=90262 RepID=A0A1X2HYA4_9FUNG|nr:homeobox domain-domain-containing protein [Absidia repens]